MAREEVYRLQARVDVLEQKLQLVLAPLHSLASRSTEHGLQDPGSLLAHSFQQLDRIDSLSEQAPAKKICDNLSPPRLDRAVIPRSL